MYSPVENLNSHANRKYTPRCLGVQFATRDREREREREREQASNLIEAIKMPSSQCLCNLLSKWNGFQPQSNSKATPTLDPFDASSSSSSSSFCFLLRPPLHLADFTSSHFRRPFHRSFACFLAPLDGMHN